MAGRLPLDGFLKENLTFRKIVLNYWPIATLEDYFDWFINWTAAKADFAVRLLFLHKPLSSQNDSGKLPANNTQLRNLLTDQGTAVLRVVVWHSQRVHVLNIYGPFPLSFVYPWDIKKGVTALVRTRHFFLSKLMPKVKVTLLPYRRA